MNSQGWRVECNEAQTGLCVLPGDQCPTGTTGPVGASQPKFQSPALARKEGAALTERQEEQKDLTIICALRYAICCLHFNANVLRNGEILVSPGE